jgi:hypothetical protein
MGLSEKWIRRDWSVPIEKTPLAVELPRGFEGAAFSV